MSDTQGKAASSAAPAPDKAPGQERQNVTIRQVDRPELSETFADAITGLFFDGQSLRIEFSVTRMDEIKQNAPVTGRRYPS
jgi:hypothetical protein